MYDTTENVRSFGSFTTKGNDDAATSTAAAASEQEAAAAQANADTAAADTAAADTAAADTDTDTDADFVDIEALTAAAPASTAPVQNAAPAPQLQHTEQIDIYQLLGIHKDDIMARHLVDAFKAHKLPEFMAAYSTDWKNMSDIDVIRHDLNKTYASIADAGRREKFINHELSAYAQDYDSDEERELALARLEVKANEIRNREIAEQQKFQPFDYSAPDPAKALADQRQALIEEQFLTATMNNPAIADFETKKAITLGKGDDAFAYKAGGDINVLNLLANPAELFLRTKEGKVPVFDVKGYIEAAVFYRNKDDIMSKMKDHYMALGRQQRDAELRNTSHGQPPIATPPSGNVKWNGRVSTN